MWSAYLFGVLALTGLVGCLGGFSLLGILWSRARAAGTVGLPEALDVLIPAHNEESVIATTVQSVRVSCERVRGQVPALRIVVGANGCQDRTAELAAGAGAEVMSFNAGSKWGALRKLLEASHAPIVALIDAGAQWPTELAVRALSAFRADPALLAFAPAYAPGSGSGPVWRVESALKSLENLAGGPVSVHGATVFYRRAALERAYQALGPSRAWLNDDVVLPLLTRATSPTARILYDASITVRDSGAEEGARASVRRQRLMAGNLEWLPLLPRIFRADRTVGLVALRRVFRIFWAWWALALGAAMWQLGTPSSALALPIRMLVILYLLSPILAARGVRAAFFASLQAPFRLASGPKGRKVEWK